MTSEYQTEYPPAGLAAAEGQIQKETVIDGPDAFSIPRQDTPVNEPISTTAALQGITSSSRPLDAALIYASMGWRVLPLHTPRRTREAISGRGMVDVITCDCWQRNPSKICENIGKHPRYDKTLLPNGKTGASADEDKVRAWWKRWPTANIGIHGGEESGMFFVDMDPRNGGEDTLRAMVDQYGALPETLRANTGGGGKHFLFQWPSGMTVPDGANILGPGLDIKGVGGYVVVAPSLHASEKRYAWENPGTPIAPAPSWMLEYFVQRQQGQPRSGGSLNSNIPLEGRLTAGARNDSLFRELCALQSRGLTDAAIRGAAESMNKEMCQPPLALSELDTVVKSVLTRYEKTPTWPLTDLGNAERLQYRFGDTIRWCEKAGGWFVWNGQRWVMDESSKIRTYAYETARKFLYEAGNSAEKDVRETYIKWSRSSESRRSTEAMLEQVKPMVSITPAEFDANTWLLNCTNGILNLRTGEMRDHRPSTYLRKQMPVDYDPEAKCPHWFNFLFEIFEGNVELIQFIQRAVGYTLTGDVSMQCLFFLYGRGANGKSTFIETLAELFGDYQAKFPNRLLMASKHDEGAAATPEIAGLAGVRMAHASEIEKGSHLAESRVKDLTGGDTITARFLHKGYFSFRPTHKLWMYGNDKPLIRGTDEGIWRRIFLLPFLYRIPEDRRRADFKESLLIPELPGILNWAVLGCRDWLERGKKLDPPGVVLAATNDYRKEMDVFGDFIDDCCLLGDFYHAKASDLYQVYTKWVNENSSGAKPMTGTAFGRELMGRPGITRERDARGRLYSGIGIRDTVLDEKEPPSWEKD